MATMAEPQEPSESPVGTQPDIEVVPAHKVDDRRVRAQRIRERSEELVRELGADHPLVAAALQKAAALEREADHPGHIHLR